MKYRRVSSLPFLLIGLIVTLLLLSACAREPSDPVEDNCLPQRVANIVHMPPYSDDDPAPFRFPLEELTAGQRLSSAPFQANGLETPTRREYHAAEDYLSPPGTPVYALAGGRVSFSGPMGGYGWLVIVDHLQANLYSLYGHLSPSRWQIDKGPVQQGQLLGYLGDDDENGGTVEQPLRPHLHLGLRAGQMNDYPGGGEWRWMAGWITPCPSDTGWLQPSKIMTAQTIPAGGFPIPNGAFLHKWGVELILAAIYLGGAIFAVIYALRRDKPYIFFTYAALTLIVAILLSRKNFAITPILFTITAISLALGLYKVIGRHRTKADPQP